MKYFLWNNSELIYGIKNFSCHQGMFNIKVTVCLSLTTIRCNILYFNCALITLTGKTPEEIRKTFNIKNDFTPEEEEQVS